MFDSFILVLSLHAWCVTSIEYQEEIKLIRLNKIEANCTQDPRPPLSLRPYEYRMTD